MHWRRRQQLVSKRGLRQECGLGKTAVMGLLERHSEKKCSQVRMQVVVADCQKETLRPVIRRHVQQDSWLYTNAHTAYGGLEVEFIHKVVDHAEKYVDGAVHTK